MKIDICPNCGAVLATSMSRNNGKEKKKWNHSKKKWFLIKYKKYKYKCAKCGYKFKNKEAHYD